MKKLKYQYHQPIKTTKRYPNLRSSQHKKFSTHQEKSFYSMHYIEYRNYPLKLRLARGTNLVNAWDDLPAYVYKFAKSWKHNSRREHQYYRTCESK